MYLSLLLCHVCCSKDYPTSLSAAGLVLLAMLLFLQTKDLWGHLRWKAELLQAAQVSPTDLTCHAAKARGGYVGWLDFLLQMTNLCDCELNHHDTLAKPEGALSWLLAAFLPSTLGQYSRRNFCYQALQGHRSVSNSFKVVVS